jgi:hypothetical protein
MVASSLTAKPTVRSTTDTTIGGSVLDCPYLYLTEAQIAKADKIGMKRQFLARQNNLKPSPRGPKMMEDEINGIRAEMAGKLYLDPVHWNDLAPSGVDLSKLPDLEDFIDVKDIQQEHHKLIVQYKDDPEWAYFLVYGAECPKFYMVGWCWGWEAMHERFDADPVGDRPAYFVPHYRHDRHVTASRRKETVIKHVSLLLQEVRRRQQNKVLGFGENNPFLESL